LGLNGSQHSAGEAEECGDEFEGAADYDADESEGKKDEPDERIEDQGCEGQGPAKESEDAEEEEVEHRVLCLLKIERGMGGKVPAGG
jgi:hypothetical protein